jgi:hypothetical protein
MPPRSGRNSYQAATASDSANSLPNPYGRRLTIDSVSRGASETSSYRRREAELDTLEQRFGHFSRRKGSGTPVTSKFREEFDNSISTLAGQKASLLSKFHLSIPKRVKLSPRSLDGTDFDDHIRPSPLSQSVLVAGPPIASQCPRIQVHEPSCPNRSSLGLGDDDSTVQLWQEAFREEARLRGRKSRESGHSPQASKGGLNGVDHKGSMRTCCPPMLGFENTVLDHGSTIKDILCPGNVDGRSSHHEEQPISEAENRDTIMGTQTTCTSVSKGKRPATTASKFPNAWAQFPSDRRAERNKAAQNGSSVTSKDFAVKGATKQGEVTWSTDKASTSLDTLSKTSQRTVSAKFSKAVKSGLHRLLPIRVNEDLKSTKARRHVSLTSGLTPRESEKGANGGDTGETRARAVDAGAEDSHGIGASTAVVHSTPRAKTRAERSNGNTDKVTLRLVDGPAEENKPVEATGGDINMFSESTLTTPDIRGHGDKGSSDNTERYATPASRRSTGVDTASFHSYPHQSRSPSEPPSRPMSTEVASLATRGEVENRRESDVESAKSESTVMKRTQRPVSMPGLHVLLLPGDGSVQFGGNKFQAWGGRGRSKTQPLLVDGTTEFGNELEVLLRAERARDVSARASESGDVMASASIGP